MDVYFIPLARLNKLVCPAYISGNSQVGIVGEEYHGVSQHMWMLDWLRLRQVASCEWRIPSKPALLYKCICCKKTFPVSGVTDLQVRASWRRTSELFYCGGFGLSLEKWWKEKKEGNKEKAGINTAVKDRNTEKCVYQTWLDC